MAYKILEQNGVDNENIDGGAFNHFAAGGRDGIVKGVLSECSLSSIGSGIGIAPGLILMCGLRVKITEMETLFLSGLPNVATQCQIIAQATLQADRSLSVKFLLQSLNELLRQDALYVAGEGIYEVRVGTFIHNVDGSISNLTRTLDIISGGSDGVGALEVGTVETTTLESGMDAVFDVTLRSDEKTGKTYLDFTAEIPKGADGASGPEASDTVPLMDGVAAIGNSNKYADAAHVHPTDTTRASTDVATQTANGLMSAADKKKLDGFNENAVTGVKGNAETNYRTGNVNLTPANIGAAPTTALTDGSVTKVGTTTKGSSTTPVYLNAGTPAACSRTIPAITLNGSANTAPSFYAPTGGGTSGYFLKSNGTGAPSWVALSSYTPSYTYLYNTSVLTTGSKTLSMSMESFGYILIVATRTNDGGRMVCLVPRTYFGICTSLRTRINLFSDIQYVSVYRTSATTIYVNDKHEDVTGLSILGVG